jgi:hypothetical protein
MPEDHMELWELQAREHIRDAMHDYSWYADRGLGGQVALQFTVDGVLESRDGIRGRGREQIARFLGTITATAPAPEVPISERPLVRHHLSNIRFVEVTPQRVRVTSYFLRLHRTWPEHWGVYRDTLVPAEGRWLIQHRFVSNDGQMNGNTLSVPILED